MVKLIVIIMHAVSSFELSTTPLGEGEGILIFSELRNLSSKHELLIFGSCMEVYEFVQDNGIGCTPNLQYTNERNGGKLFSSPYF